MDLTRLNRKEMIKDSIGQLITVLGEDLVAPEDENIKTAIKTKITAFNESKEFIALLQDIDHKPDIQWYRDTISKLIDAAESAVTELSNIMSTPIKGATVEKNRIIESKREAYQYVDLINAGTLELRGILIGIDEDGEVRKIDNGDFKSGFAEDYSYEGSWNKANKKSKPGVRPDGRICIAYDGTEGKTVNCFGLKIILPKPNLKKSRRKKEDQYWRRPKDADKITRGNAASNIDLIREEFRRRDEGYWFWNNGEEEYITGAHYMLMTHLKTDAEGGYFHFRKAHRDVFYHLEATWVDHRSLGSILGKTRRTGYSYVATAFSLTKGISVRNAIFGMTSKTDRDAGKLFNRVTHAFKHLPFYFKPMNTGEALKSSLSFMAPSERRSKNTKDRKYNELNTVMDFQATGEDSYDSLTVKHYIADELSKWLRGNTLKHWSKIRKALMKGGRVHGKAFVLSTVEYFTGTDPREKGAKAGDMFKKLFYDSDPNKRSKSGMTKSGLYKIFVSALDNYEGFIDRYGNCIAETPEEPVVGVDGQMITMGARQFIQANLEQYKDDPDAYNDERRKDPIVEQDMFRIASADSLFNVTKLQDQIDHNEMTELSVGKPGYMTGNFEYIDANEKYVKFRQCVNGRFLISWTPPLEMQNQSIMKGGKIAPRFDYIGLFGVDPYKVAKVAYGKGSKGSIVGYLNDVHAISGVPNDEFFLVYNGRPQSLEVFFNDLIMATKFYSMQALIESNINELLKVMYNKGLTNYSMRRPDKLPANLSLEEKLYGGIPGNNLNLLYNQASFVQKHIDERIGYADEESQRPIGEIGKCPFNALLQDLMVYDILDRTKHDLSVAASLAVYGSQKFVLKQPKKSGILATQFYRLHSVKQILASGN